MAVSIKSPRVDALLEQLRQLTGRGATEIVREALELELQRQRRLSRRRLSAKLSARGAALSTAAILLRDVGHAFKVLDRVVINIGPAAKD
jgi:hypothetical protein